MLWWIVFVLLYLCIILSSYNSYCLFQSHPRLFFPLVCSQWIPLHTLCCISPFVQKHHPLNWGIILTTTFCALFLADRSRCDCLQSFHLQVLSRRPLFTICVCRSLDVLILGCGRRGNLRLAMRWGFDCSYFIFYFLRCTWCVLLLSAAVVIISSL